MAQPAKKKPKAVDPDAGRSTLELIAEVVPDYEVWLRTPNTRFGGRAPGELIGTPNEWFLRNTALSLKYGIFS